MKIIMNNPAEYDRHESEIRFVAIANGENINVTVTDGALFIIREALGMPYADPLVTYAAGGSLLKQVVADLVSMSKELQPTYLVTHLDVLRLTGSDPRLPHVPLKMEAVLISEIQSIA